MSTENAQETGLLLAFEGGDGSGKTSLVKAVQKAWIQRMRRPGDACDLEHVHKCDACGFPQVRSCAGGWTHEVCGAVHAETFPTHTGEVGRLIRRVFAEPQLVDRRSMLWLFAADGMDRQGQISGWLQAGEHVLLDRSPLISAWAYQTDEHPIEQIILVAPFFGLVPHLIFLLDCSATTALARLTTRGQELNPLYESGGVERFERVRKRLLAYAALHDNVLILDAAQPIETNVEAVLIAIDAFQKARS